MKAFNNTVVSTTNYGIAISAGHDLEYLQQPHRLVGRAAGRTHDRSQNVGAYVWDIHHAGSTASTTTRRTTTCRGLGEGQRIAE